MSRRWKALTALRLLMSLLLATSLAIVTQATAQASTSQFRGVNWADQRDNFVNGVLYPSGLSASDTYSSAAVVADRVVGQLYSLTGANTVRIPINEPTVTNYWGTYTGAIDTALGKGNVIFAYWAHTGGRPQNQAAFERMWDTVIAKYGSHPNAYFEVINEPHGYSTTDLNNMYNSWLTRYSSVPRGRVVLDGAGLAQNVPAVGGDSRLNGTLLAVHDYSFFAGFESETQWADHIASYIGAYASRTIATEWGGAMGPGTKNGVYFDAVDYSVPSGSYMADYIRGVSAKLRSLGMGGVYWPGLRDGDWYSLTTRSGSGSGTTLSLTNRSGLQRLRYSWGLGDAGTEVAGIRNVGTGWYVDGLGRTTESPAGQGTGGASPGQRWVVENSGAYVRIKNATTGLYLDGLGRTANGSDAVQRAGNTATSQQWTVVTGTSRGNDVRIRNRATGLYLDGMGRASTSANLGQWSDSNSVNQQWRIVAAG
ncbi:RICIN domain-containing protein [Lentzea sp. BCCO 10_0061]|uniref:RICIN domain-containing protein n=1 Tax=Lentzea sokolovensis TaxID=3095429 RepID=A0ABU4USL8_9PSEU|nr:RICIN domain-containing protein [Lentzea sp. BCCO 10_0061]MDX8142469.1 RICIN domain-containing protein [Lentzea sp. BCCO 10_0061]